MKLKSIISVIMVILLSVFVIGFSVNEISKPLAYSTSTSLKVNVSGGFNASGITGLQANDTINVTILNKSSLSGAYGIYNGTGDTIGGLHGYIINASGETAGSHRFWNKTITLTEERHWIRLNCTNCTSGGSLTSERIIDIDIDYNVYQLGRFDTLNFSLDTGNFNTSGTISAPVFKFQNASADDGSCDFAKTGELIWNGTTSENPVGRLLICNGANWYEINMTLA